MMVKQIEQLSMSIFLYVCVNSTIYQSKNIFFFVYTEKKSEWFGCRREKKNFKHFSLLLVQKYSKRTAFWSFDRSKSMQWIRKYDVYFIFMLNNLNFRFNLNVRGGDILLGQQTGTKLFRQQYREKAWNTKEYLAILPCVPPKYKLKNKTIYIQRSELGRCTKHHY